MISCKRNVVRLLVVGMCTLGLPIPQVQAELVATDRVDASHRWGDSPRERMNTLFDRADVRAALEKHGVSVDDARSRVNALSDSEVETLATRFDSLPAAGSGFEALLWISFITFIVLLVTDILGFTKVFSFTRPAK